MTRLHGRLLAGLLLLLLAACATTPGDRIKKNPGLFNSFAPEAQEKIRAGEIDLGFTQEMVLMARDKPDRKYARRTAGGEVEVWSYIGLQTKTDRQRVEVRGRAPDAGGRWYSYHDWVWVDVNRQQEYEMFRIEFVDGKVTAFESLVR